jgi:hypothetical protein
MLVGDRLAQRPLCEGVNPGGKVDGGLSPLGLLLRTRQLFSFPNGHSGMGARIVGDGL